MKKKIEANTRFPETLCARCGNKIEPTARRCMYCRLEIKTPEDIVKEIGKGRDKP